MSGGFDSNGDPLLGGGYNADLTQVPAGKNMLLTAQSRYYGEGNEPCTLAEIRATLDAAIAAAEARL